MSFHNIQFGERFVASSLALFAASGLNLRVGYDFHQYRELIQEAREGHVVGRPFDPDLHDFSDGSAFWILAADKAGKVVHSQALRMLDLTGRSLADHLNGHFTDFPPPSIELDLSKSNYRAGPGASRMTGRIAYHGEFWIGGEEGQFRGGNASSLLARYGFWMATQHWDISYIFAFILNQVHYKGLAARTGWMHTDPAALQWYPKDGRGPIETVMAYLSKGDVEFLLDLPLLQPKTIRHRQAA